MKEGGDGVSTAEGPAAGHFFTVCPFNFSRQNGAIVTTLAIPVSDAAMY